MLTKFFVLNLKTSIGVCIPSEKNYYIIHLSVAESKIAKEDK